MEKFFNSNYTRYVVVANALENMLLLIEQGLDGVYFRDNNGLANTLDDAALEVWAYTVKSFDDSELKERIKKTATALGDSFKGVFRFYRSISPYDIRRAKHTFKQAAELVAELRGPLVINWDKTQKQLNKAVDAFTTIK